MFCRSPAADASEVTGRTSIRKKSQMSKYVYFFGGGKADGRADMKDLLGGKGANLAEMTNIGLPVPAGFTITTEVCTYFYANDRKYPAELKDQVAGRHAPDRRSHGRRRSAIPKIRCSSPAAPAPASPCRA